MMSKGFILNKYSEKVGEFKAANLDITGLWNLSDVNINQDYIDIASKATKEPYLFILVDETSVESSFAITGSIGVGFMFSNSESWCCSNNMNFKEAYFIEDKDKGNSYEN